MRARGPINPHTRTTGVVAHGAIWSPGQQEAGAARVTSTMALLGLRDAMAWALKAVVCLFCFCYSLVSLEGERESVHVYQHKD